MVAPAIEELWERYRTKGLLIDSNLLLVYFIALFDPELVDASSERERFPGRVCSSWVTSLPRFGIWQRLQIL